MPLAPSRSTALLLVLFAGCYDKPGNPSADTDTTEGTASETGMTSASTSSPTSTVGESSTGVSTTASTSATTTTADDTTSTDPTTTDATVTASGSESTGGGPITICEQEPTTLAACKDASQNLLNQGTLACDPAAMFTAFFEDVWTVEVGVGECIYANVDNISDAGPVGGMQADVAFQLRSPSGAYAYADDEVACQDVTWTGGACPQATLIADAAGTWEISVVQASGAGCVAAAPYILYVALNGVEVTATQTIDDQRTDC